MVGWATSSPAARSVTRSGPSSANRRSASNAPTLRPRGAFARSTWDSSATRRSSC